MVICTPLNFCPIYLYYSILLVYPFNLTEHVYQAPTSDGYDEATTVVAHMTK